MQDYFNKFKAQFINVHIYEPIEAIDEFVEKWQTYKGREGATLEAFEKILREQDFNFDAGNSILRIIKDIMY